MGAPDSEILVEAGSQRLTLATYDQRTLWKHAADIMPAGREHGGVIFVDEWTIPPNDIGGLMRSLVWGFKGGLPELPPPPDSRIVGIR